MLLRQPKKLAVALICYISIALTVTSVSEARENVDFHRRDHNILNRMVKKRSPQILPPVTTGVTTSSVVTSSIPPSSLSSSSRIVASPPASSVVAAPSTTALPTSSASSVTSSSTSSSSSRSLSSQPTQTPTLPPNIPTTSIPGGVPTTFITSTTVAAAEPTESSGTGSSMSKTGRMVITILIAIAASVGAILIIWTIIRKWKLSKSESFEDRMQPIDWQPTTRDDDLPVHRRVSVASVHSGTHEANVTSYGVGDGYGSADHNHGAAGLGPLPDHDFTAGTTSQHFTAGGGYADLARGVGPEPQMQEAYGQGPAAYGGYTTHDAYDYSARAAVRY